MWVEAERSFQGDKIRSWTSPSSWLAMLLGDWHDGVSLTTVLVYLLMQAWTDTTVRSVFTSNPRPILLHLGQGKPWELDSAPQEPSCRWLRSFSAYLTGAVLRGGFCTKSLCCCAEARVANGNLRDWIFESILSAVCHIWRKGAVLNCESSSLVGNRKKSP